MDRLGKAIDQVAGAFEGWKSWFDTRTHSIESSFRSHSGRTNFRALRPGELFLFKLHAPHNYIVGGGVFSHATSLPLSLAWETFETKNGAPSLAEMRRRIIRYRKGALDEASRVEPAIGCRILTSPFFWPRDHWLPVPENWARNIVVGRGYDTRDADGARLWDTVLERTNLTHGSATAATERSRYGIPILVPPRLGQGAFRVVVTDAYERQATLTTEQDRTLRCHVGIARVSTSDAHVPGLVRVHESHV